MYVICMKASLTIFQVLSTDNWNNVWYDIRRASSEWEANFFLIPVVVFGEYIYIYNT